MGKRIVIALGGNALGKNLPEQMAAVHHTAKAVADLIEEGHEIVIVHGNGPQVGMINIAMTTLSREDRNCPMAPMSVCTAMSEGYIGYDLQNSLREELLDREIHKAVSTILTQVEVDPNDPAFQHPTKPIGTFMTEEEAEEMRRRGNAVMEDAGRGWRRCVASPLPKSIVEIETIEALLKAGQVVIACGGGGIPVIEQRHTLKGASAVIEKDSIAGKLAADLQADLLIILTGVEQVYTDYGKETQTGIASMTVAQAKAYIEEKQFGEGNMLPKIEAAITYLDSVPEGKVLITDLAHASEAAKGRTGTVIVRE